MIRRICNASMQLTNHHYLFYSRVGAKRGGGGLSHVPHVPSDAAAVPGACAWHPALPQYLLLRPPLHTLPVQDPLTTLLAPGRAAAAVRYRARVRRVGTGVPAGRRRRAAAPAPVQRWRLRVRHQVKFTLCWLAAAEKRGVRKAYGGRLTTVENRPAWINKCPWRNGERPC